MVKRIHDAEANERLESFDRQSRAVELPELEEKIDDQIKQMPDKSGLELTQEAANEIFEHEVNVVYQIIRDHIESLGELEAEQLMSEDKLREVIEECFKKIPVILSAPGTRLRTIDREIENLEEVANLIALYRHKYEQQLRSNEADEAE